MLITMTKTITGSLDDGRTSQDFLTTRRSPLLAMTWSLDDGRTSQDFLTDACHEVLDDIAQQWIVEGSAEERDDVTREMTQGATVSDEPSSSSEVVED